jgi:hypothetical protein
MKVSAPRNSVHDAKKANSAVLAMPGTTDGSRTRQKEVTVPAPSI